MRYTTVGDLFFQYDSGPVLEGINYHLDSGEFITLTGENGVAKFMLVKATLSILILKSGQVTIPKTNKKGKKLRIAYLPQWVASLNVGPPSMVYESVKSGRYSRNGWLRRLIKHDDEHVKISLESVGVRESRHKRIGSLSGGQKQRVVIARVFISGPDIFILDGPATGMDAGTIETFYELVHHSTHKHGKSVLMIIHDPDEVKHYAGRNIHLIRSQKTPWCCFNVHGTDAKGAADVD